VTDDDSEENPDASRRPSQRLLRARRIEKPSNGGDPIGRKAYASGVLLDGRLVGGEVDAIHLVAGHVTMEPLDLGTHSLQNVDRLLGDFPQLSVGETSGARDFAFDYKFGHHVLLCASILTSRPGAFNTAC
jgi:hypothetical protein